MIGAMRTVGPLCLTLGMMTLPATARAEASALPLLSLRAPAEPADTPQPTSSKAPDSATPQPTSSKAPDSATPQPTSSKAPASAAPVADPTEPVEEPVEASEDEPTGDQDGDSLKDQRRLAARDTEFHRHALGARGGIVIIPTWLLSRWLATHSNALCRGSNVGGFAGDRGLQQQDGCNFYVGGEYTYRFSRVLDISAAVAYQRAHTPDGLWLDKARASGAAADLGAADYTEIELGLIAIEVDFIARAPLVVTKDVEWGLGGGAGLGLGIVLGGIYQTPLGATPEGFTAGGGRTPNTCQSVDDLGDLTRCTPRYDAAQDPPDGANQPDPSELSSPNPGLFADCTRERCNEDDLAAFGYRNKQTGIPPVIPVVNLIVSTRLIVKDTVGIVINGGFNTGFYFGGALQFFFGKPQQDEMGKGATIGMRPSGRRSS